MQKEKKNSLGLLHPEDLTLQNDAQSTWANIQEDLNLYVHCCENLKS